MIRISKLIAGLVSSQRFIKCSSVITPLTIYLILGPYAAQQYVQSKSSVHERVEVGADDPIAPEYKEEDRGWNQLVFWTLVLTVLMLAHRVWFYYNPLIQLACPSRARLCVGEITAVGLCLAVFGALTCAVLHRHVVAEMIVATAEVGLLGILFVAFRRVGNRRTELVVALLQENIHLVILVWIAYVTQLPAWNGESAVVGFLLVGAVVVIHTQYALHVVLDEFTGGQNNRTQDDSPRGGQPNSISDDADGLEGERPLLARERNVTPELLDSRERYRRAQALADSRRTRRNSRPPG